jgi:DNA-binding MarR family transcriptional regulator
MVGVMVNVSEDVVQAERALERLFRLTANRKMQPKQTAAVGADVSRAGYAVLRCVEAAGELTLGDIAAECAMDPAAVSRQVRVLEVDGMLRRATHEDDARVTVVTLTPTGRKVYRRIVEFRTSYMTEVLAGWSAADRDTLARLVNRLVDDFTSVPFRVRKNGH